MKSILIAALLLVSFNVFSQCKTYKIGVKGDTLNCTDNNDLKQGKWVEHHDKLRGEPGYEEEGVYKDGKKNGLWRKYSLMGDILAMENYKMGNKNGKSQYFNLNGLIREESWKAIDPENPYDTIDIPDIKDDSKVYTKVVKVDALTVKQGVWNYYDPATGVLLKSETYVLDQLYDPNKKTTVIDASAPSKDTTATAGKKAVPKEVADYEKKNSGKKKIKVRDGRTGY